MSDGAGSAKVSTKMINLHDDQWSVKLLIDLTRRSRYA